MKFIAYLTLLVLVEVAKGQTISDPVERARQEEAISNASEFWRERFQQVNRSSEPFEVIEQLAGIAKAMNSFHQSKGRLDVQPATDLLKEAQSELVSIPGHAEHYRKKMEEGMARFEATPEGRRSLLMGAFGSRQSEIFKALEVMPSPEAVKVLGDYLSDERGWDSNKGHEVPVDSEGNIDGEGLVNVQRNCNVAVRSLARLIENPPESENVYPPVALPAWRLWYNQVKAGNRTYRFKGDPTEYDLNGPVRDSKNMDTIRTARRAAPESHSETEPKGRSNAPTITFGIITLILGGGYWIYRRKSLA